MRRVWLLLKKDALVLRRSPLLLAVVLAYPVAIAILVGLVAGYSSAKPRVALVDEDNLPPTVVIAGKRFHVDHTIGQVSKNVDLVRGLSPAAAQRELANGKVVAVVTVPPGFIATLKQMVKSPQLEVQLSHGTISSRVKQQVQALVYSLNRQLQQAYIETNLNYVGLILHGGSGSFLGQPIDVIGLERAEQELGRLPQTPRVRRLENFVHDARLALANTGDALRATARPIELVYTNGRGRTTLLAANVQAYALGVTISSGLGIWSGRRSHWRRRSRSSSACRSRSPSERSSRSAVSPAASPGGGCRCSSSGSSWRAVRSGRSARSSAHSPARAARPRSSRCWSCCRSSSLG